MTDAATQPREEAIGERLDGGDGGHHRIGEPARLVVTDAARPRLAGQHQSDRAGLRRELLRKAHAQPDPGIRLGARMNRLEGMPHDRRDMGEAVGLVEHELPIYLRLQQLTDGLLARQAAREPDAVDGLRGACRHVDARLSHLRAHEQNLSQHLRQATFGEQLDLFVEIGGALRRRDDTGPGGGSMWRGHRFWRHDDPLAGRLTLSWVGKDRALLGTAAGGYDVARRDVEAKRAAAEEWATFVNDDGRFGTWRYLFCSETAIKNARGGWDGLLVAAGISGLP